MVESAGVLAATCGHCGRRGRLRSLFGGGPQQARGPGFNNWDASVLKNFTFTEALRLQFRAEAFNLFNTTPLGQPGSLGNFTTTNFASITTARNGGNASRRLQFALKLFY